MCRAEVTADPNRTPIFILFGDPDVRPTLILLASLVGDYTHDGCVLFEVLRDNAIPVPLRQDRATLTELAAAYKAINAPLGRRWTACCCLASAGPTSSR